MRVNLLTSTAPVTIMCGANPCTVCHGGVPGVAGRVRRRVVQRYRTGAVNNEKMPKMA